MVANTSAKRPAARKQAARKAETTRVEILTAAAHLFAEKGYSDCNLRELAERVGMKAGSFYYHFRSKQEILDELVVASVDMVLNAVSNAIHDLGPDATYVDRLVAAMRAHLLPYIQSEDAHAAALMRVWEHTPPAMRHRMRAKRREYAQVWYELVEEGIREGVIRDDDPRMLVAFMLGSMGRVQEWFNPRYMDMETVCDYVIRMLLAGALMPEHRLEPA